MSAGAEPAELAPWSTLEPASSSGCAQSHDGVRAVVQTAAPWIAVEGSPGFRRTPGMNALVRWTPTRVCLEAVEVGYREIEDQGTDARTSLKVMAVARFVGAAAGGGLVGLSASEALRERARCTIE